MAGADQSTKLDSTVNLSYLLNESRDVDHHQHAFAKPVIEAQTEEQMSQVLCEDEESPAMTFQEYMDWLRQQPMDLARATYNSKLMNSPPKRQWVKAAAVEAISESMERGSTLETQVERQWGEAREAYYSEVYANPFKYQRPEILLEDRDDQDDEAF